jgi:NAD(P)-dependent dehydrogenase (short-subunit alcohol dehydrogenase family)
MESKKNALIIGGTDGIGKEIALSLAKANCQIIIIGRDIEKGIRLKNEIQISSGNSSIEFFEANLFLLSEANRLADKIINHFSQLHYLVHSAGVIMGKRTITSEGIETNFAINYLSRFVITQRLLPLLEKGGKSDDPSRILLISGAAMNGKIYYEDVNLTSNFSLIRFVSQQCHANDLFIIEQASKLLENKCDTITINIYKLGVVKTNIRKNFPVWMKWIVYLIFDPLLGLTPKEAAEPVIRLLLDKKYQKISGAIFIKIKKFKQARLSEKMMDKNERIKLWNFSKQMIEKSKRKIS